MDQGSDVENIHRVGSRKGYMELYMIPLLHCWLTCRHSSTGGKFSQTSKRVYYRNLLARSMNNRFRETAVPVSKHVQSGPLLVLTPILGS